MTTPGGDRPRGRRDPARLHARAPIRRAGRSPTTAPPASSRRPRWSGPTIRTRPTGPGGRRCARVRTTCSATRHVFEAWFGVREQLPRTIARDKPREISPPLPMGDPGERGGEVEPRRGPRRSERRRGAPPPGRGRAEARREGAAGRDDRCAPTPVAAPSRRSSYAVAPRGDRHAPHPAYDAAPDGRARDASSTGAAGRPRAGWCCSWTSRRRCGRTPTRSCAWRTWSRASGHAERWRCSPSAPG